MVDIYSKIKKLFNELANQIIKKKWDANASQFHLFRTVTYRISKS